MTADEIKEKYSMFDIISKYGLHPNRSGFICCPFHKGDRQASMKIYQKDYHCFGCGANGDIFSFIQEMEKVSFRDAFLSLGGTYPHMKESRFLAQMKLAQRKREAEEAKIREEEFQQWRKKRLTQIATTLQCCDALQDTYKPFSSEWSILLEEKQKNEYKWEILAYGTRKEMEEMRECDG